MRMNEAENIFTWAQKFEIQYEAKYYTKNNDKIMFTIMYTTFCDIA